MYNLIYFYIHIHIIIKPISLLSHLKSKLKYRTVIAIVDIPNYYFKIQI